MPIHDFSEMVPISAVPLPAGLPSMPSARQSGHSGSGRTPMDGSGYMAYPYNLEEYLIPGFRSLDEAMKNYWSGIRVPTIDSFRYMRVKIAGGNKSLLVWSDDLNGGRARMPVAAISREGHEFNPQKFSPAYHPMQVRYLNSRGTLAAQIFRPVPFIVSYNLTIWAEHKRDVEYILHQTLVRFNPMAEFRMFDGKIAGNVQLQFGGSTDASDKEVGFDQSATVRHEVMMKAEAWLPLPELVGKTVLGKSITIREQVGKLLSEVLSNV